MQIPSRRDLTQFRGYTLDMTLDFETSAEPPALPATPVNPPPEAANVYRDAGLSSKVEWLRDGRVLVDGIEDPEMEGWLP